ncbi:MAG TPA: FecR domain-containing protein [Niabella sp.]|nr:FecR domain-containing protein [Niabella sp.]
MDCLPEEVSLLYKKWLSGAATEEEQEALLQWLETPGIEEMLSGDMWNTWEALRAKHIGERESVTEPLLPGKEEPIIPIATKKSSKVVWFRRALAGAAAVLIIVTGYIFLLPPSGQPVNTVSSGTGPEEVSSSNDMLPGRDGAILTLGDKSTLVLDAMSRGIVARQQDVVVRLEQDELKYLQETDMKAPVVYNKMTTPKGRRFRVVLADGTKVWLNAGSSISYPVPFAVTERRVEVSGEAYFDVAPNKKKPFRVVSKNAEVEVLGTQFNFSAYEDQLFVSATLLEGSLRFTSGKEQVLLKPGQQAVKNGEAQGLKLVKNIDSIHVAAWKRGVFDFNNASLQEVLRELSRWYDFEVVYQDAVAPDIVFGGRMGTDLSLSQALKALQVMGVKFTLQNKTLYVK